MGGEHTTQGRGRRETLRYYAIRIHQSSGTENMCSHPSCLNCIGQIKHELNLTGPDSDPS